MQVWIIKLWRMQTNKKKNEKWSKKKVAPSLTEKKNAQKTFVLKFLFCNNFKICYYRRVQFSFSKCGLLPGKLHSFFSFCSQEMIKWMSISFFLVLRETFSALIYNKKRFTDSIFRSPVSSWKNRANRAHFLSITQWLVKQLSQSS